MKSQNLLTLVSLTLMSTLAFAGTIQKTGTIVVGYDKAIDAAITKQISVSYSDSSDEASISIEGEGKISASRENSEVSGYVTAPRKFFYYKLNLNPETKEFFSGKTAIVLDRVGELTSGCKEDATALLTGYKGDGTKKNFCVTLK
jgi:hypothetical protein